MNIPRMTKCRIVVTVTIFTEPTVLCAKNIAVQNMGGMDIYVQKRRCRKTMDDFINKAVVYKTAEKMEELARARFESAPAGSEERKILYAQLMERVTFKYMIASEHAANVREDVQGEWEWFEEKLGTPIDGWDLDWGWRCSRCKDTLNDEYDDPDSPPKFNFCPNCGARMK